MAFKIESIVTILFTIAIILTNTIILFVLAWTDSLRNINKIYFGSLTIADLCVGLFITPFAVYSTFSNSWIYEDEIFCHIEAYLMAIFFIAGVYSLSWISVDHYLAIRKPQRHKTAMSTTRSLCWIIFAWLAAFCFCSPPLFSKIQRASYYDEIFMCSIDPGPQKPYFATAGIIVLCPALLALIFTNSYIFTERFRSKKHMFENILIDTATRPKNYFMNFVVSIVFFLSWLPWLMLQIAGTFLESHSDYPHKVHFYFLWIAIGNSFYKFFIYMTLSLDFRRGLKQLCCQRECSCNQCTVPQNVSINLITAKT
ncbi:probable G-protein coupled receptor 21 [Mytilus californianus]|uniref:probable G-protein coupled receptor 21 n=1 Tax=Mytilus californianus TaxID=6549 RepID=UPI002247619F|nr:probable G-protein coupled receptor 21 [Mytilus californianus]